MESTVVWNRPRDSDRIRSAILVFTTGSGSKKTRDFLPSLGLLGFLCIAALLPSQSPLQSIPAQQAFPLHSMPGSLSIEREAVPSRPFSVVGPRGAVLGQQDGSFELWLFPWKVLSDLRISAQMDNYPVPIDLNQHAAWIEVRPDSTIITFSHANFTVREIVLAPRQAPDGAGALVLFRIEAVRPMTMTFSFTDRKSTV